jgi:hypothetical protein
MSTRKQVYPDLPATEMFAYDGHVPGPTFKMHKGRGKTNAHNLDIKLTKLQRLLCDSLTSVQRIPLSMSTANTTALLLTDGQQTMPCPASTKITTTQMHKMHEPSGTMLVNSVN